MSKFVNAYPLNAHTPKSFQTHLRSIINHVARVKAKRKRDSKERAAFTAQFNTKPKAKAWSFRVNEKGTIIITIRKRKPAYLTRSEYEEITREFATYEKDINKVLEKRKINIIEDGEIKDLTSPDS